LRAEVAELRAENVKIGELMTVIATLTERIAELEWALAAESSDSSPPPSSDAPWAKKPAKKRSSRTRSGRKPGRQPGASGFSRSLIDDPDDRLVIQLDRCHRCDASRTGATEHGRQRRQVIDLSPAPPPTVTEYQRIWKICGCCGAITTLSWKDDAVAVEHA
jgi:transposase